MRKLEINSRTVFLQYYEFLKLQELEIEYIACSVFGPCTFIMYGNITTT